MYVYRFEKMAEKHWVSEVFPVNFALEEFLKKGENSKVETRRSKGIQDRYEEIYQQIIAEEATESELIPENNKENFENIGLINETRRSRGRTEREKKTKKDCKDGPLWTKDELAVFRSRYFNLKKETMNLVVLLSTTKSDLKSLKKNYKSKEKIIKQKDDTLREQLKQNQRLNITVNELKQDVVYYDKQVKHLEITETELKSRVSSMKKELEKERTEVEKMRKMARDLSLSLKKEQESKEPCLIELKTELKMGHLGEVKLLEDDNSRLTEELEKERNEHRLANCALEQLRKHFASMQVTKSDPMLLNVVEI